LPVEALLPALPLVWLLPPPVPVTPGPPLNGLDPSLPQAVAAKKPSIQAKRWSVMTSISLSLLCALLGTRSRIAPLDPRTQCQMAAPALFGQVLRGSPPLEAERYRKLEQ
jgi:hypothetical protein